MYQILGTTDALPNGGVPLPEIEIYSVPGEGERACGLIGVKRGAVYYREIATPLTGRFNEAQR